MMYDDVVLCADFSRDSKMLASGSQDGKIKVWRFRTSQCLWRLERAHSQGVTSVSFSRDGSQLLSTSFDRTTRAQLLVQIFNALLLQHILYLSIVKCFNKMLAIMLKEFCGHTLHMNDAIFTNDGSHVIIDSSDYTIKVWDVQTTDHIQTFKPPPPLRGGDASINYVHISPKNTDHIVVVKSFSSGKRESEDFVATCVSPKGEWIYFVGEDKYPNLCI
ncbi:hypothetical protein JHK85_004417 [Glycine max]|uniref:Uncharacterized protein n=2 Tax=Glycine subgen. Soja TaxID=1462606 RepID=K7K8K8_SOYBN|nr:hypothetical protein JHK85_004417 [Glycine max]KAG5080183.1 hypothetical protein JHK86_004248 [Glycine max]KAH1060532.1 hypothetical protein GYH30_004142 [Glycine max]